MIVLYSAFLKGEILMDLMLSHCSNIPYSLKILRVKFFMNFGIPTKILALKILS